jgi:cytochrome c biogenesis protein CcmG/thiol:disulfide interchange protein DsbE
MSEDASARTWARFGAAAALLGVGAVVALLAFGLVSRAGEDRIREALQERTATEAPDFALAVLADGEPPRRLRRPLAEALGDGELSPAELRGTPIVLNFWASWCDPCREEATVLERGWRRDGPRGVLYVGLNMQDLTEDAEQFLAEFAVSYPTIRDPGRDVADDYGLTGIPETFFIDRRGRIVAQAIGVLDSHLLEVGVAAARQGRVAGLLQGGAQGEPR